VIILHEHFGEYAAVFLFCQSKAVVEVKKWQKKSLIKIRLKNENTHKNYIVRGAITI
jgi:hypothetical protein